MRFRVWGFKGSVFWGLGFSLPIGSFRFRLLFFRVIVLGFEVQDLGLDLWVQGSVFWSFIFQRVTVLRFQIRLRVHSFRSVSQLCHSNKMSIELSSITLTLQATTVVRPTSRQCLGNAWPATTVPEVLTRRISSSAPKATIA
jgi:hypothetical protein